jgi:NitT/TauT family transport system ATP-binding protein
VTQSASAASASAIVVSGVSKVFGPGRPGAVEALADIDLTVPRGAFVSLIGPSGCGKSTLLRLVAALTQPTAGTISVLGAAADQARRDRQYGMAFQQAGLLDWRTVARNVELPLDVMGWSQQERRVRVREMLALVRLGDFADHYPAQLSGGMQQRVAIARALSFRPSVLLMDEPFGALDEMTREHLQTELLRIWQETDTTVLFVTHSIPEAVFLSNRVVVLSPRPGRIAAEMPVDLGQRTEETREDERFFATITAVREVLRAVERDAAPATSAQREGP